MSYLLLSVVLVLAFLDREGRACVEKVVGGHLGGDDSLPPSKNPRRARDRNARGGERINV